MKFGPISSGTSFNRPHLDAAKRGIGEVDGEHVRHELTRNDTLF